MQRLTGCVIRERIRAMGFSAAGVFAAVLIFASEAVAGTELPECLQDLPPAPVLWTPEEWTTQFGTANTGVAQTSLQDDLEFSFFHFRSNLFAEPIVLVIGHSAVLLEWDPLILFQLKQCFDVYLIDNLGLGYSRFNGGPLEQLALLDLMKTRWDAIGNFVHEAVQAIRQSDHCSGNPALCGIVGQAPHLMGWAMGGKVIIETVALHPGQYGSVINLGGDLASNQGSTGPNPLAVALLQDDSPVAASKASFFVNPGFWGLAPWLAGVEADVEDSLRTAPNYLVNPDGHPTQVQKDAQGNASSLSLTPLGGIENEIFTPYGFQDDHNFCYPDTESRFEEVCVLGDYCVDADCAEPRQPRVACTEDPPDQPGGEPGTHEAGCLWGLAPLGDYSLARSLLENSSKVCYRGFEGAHGFPSQSLEEVIPAIVNFINGNTDSEEWDCDVRVRTIPTLSPVLLTLLSLMLAGLGAVALAKWHR